MCVDTILGHTREREGEREGEGEGEGGRERERERERERQGLTSPLDMSTTRLRGRCGRSSLSLPLSPSPSLPQVCTHAFSRAHAWYVCAYFLCCSCAYARARASVRPPLPAAVVQILAGPCCKHHLSTHASESARACLLISTNCSCRNACLAAQDRQHVPSNPRTLHSRDTSARATYCPMALLAPMRSSLTSSHGHSAVICSGVARNLKQKRSKSPRQGSTSSKLAFKIVRTRT
jgi:hypothetical protein